MKEKIKRHLLKMSYRTAAAAGIFILLFVLSRTAENLFGKMSAVWTKDADLLKAAELFKEFIKALI